MGANKLDFYTDDQIQMANIFKALGHPARIALLDNLTANDNLNCTDLTTLIPLAKSTISYHLKQLFENGILGYAVRGSNCYYQPQTATIKSTIDYLECIQVALQNKCMLIRPGYIKPRLIHKLGFFFRV